MRLAEAQKILASIGWPTNVLVLDFETFYDTHYTLRKVSYIEYVHDARFEFTGVVVWRMGTWEKPSFRGGPEATEQCIRDMQAQYGENLERCTLVVANDKFEGSILKYRFGVTPPHVIDIQNIDRHIEARTTHNVEAMAERWEVGESKGDTKQFKGWYWRDMDAEKRAKLKEYTLGDGSIEGKLFEILLPMWSNPHTEIPLAQLTLESYLTPTLRVNEVKAQEIIEAYNIETEEAIAATGYTQKEISGRISFEEILCKTLGDEKPPMKIGKDGPIPAIAKEDEGRKALLFHQNKHVRQLMEAKVALSSNRLHQRRVEKMLAQSAPLGGILPLAFVYHGAHPGRWAGTQKINPQNFPPKIKPILEARTGRVLIDADQSQIEARGLAWVADETELVEGFRNGEDIYSDFASDILGVPVRKPQSSDPPPVYRTNKTRRQFGKVGILGSGYRMGGDHCLEFMRTNSMVADDLAPLIESGEINLQFAHRLIAKYRARFRNVVAFWSDIEDAFIRAYHMKQDIEFRHGVVFMCDGTTVGMQLPSGRVMRYQGVRVGYKKDIRWKYGYLHGGVLTENLVQAMSRDIIAENMLALREEGYVPALTVHDSIVNDVPLYRKAKAITTMETIMRTPPTWAPDWPVDMEYTVGKSYG